MLGTESLVCLPLVSGNRCLGVMVGGVAAWQVPGCQKRERFLQSFGAQAATALETALPNAATPAASWPASPRNTAKRRAAWCTR
jgi:GAF domain-containing protein